MNILNLNLIIDVLIYSLIPLGLWISFRIMRYPDLAIEQVFVLGGVIFGLISEFTTNPLAIVPFFIIASIILGILISFFRYRLSLNPIILSLIFSYIFFSLSLFLMGRPNLSLLEYYENNIPKNTLLVFALSILIVLSIAYHYFFKSNKGSKVIATGCNPDLSKRIGLQSFLHGSIGISMSYFIVMIGGALYSLKLRNADISYGGGFLLMSIFIVLICRLFINRISFIKNALAIIFATLIYTVILQFIISLNFPSELTRGFYAIMLLLLVIFSPKSKIKLF
ncbi:MAG: hypothetical protein K8R41_00560 [Bacteroidales bacterium]|nr:hypothetical protein [Bacteroidales bacterium]